MGQDVRGGRFLFPVQADAPDVERGEIRRDRPDRALHRLRVDAQIAALGRDHDAAEFAGPKEEREQKEK